MANCKCKKCNTFMGVGATKCPYCGKNQRSYLGPILICIVVLLICLYAYADNTGKLPPKLVEVQNNIASIVKSLQANVTDKVVVSGGTHNTSKQSTGPIASLSLSELSGDFYANSIAAKQKYLNKTITLTGYVSAIATTDGDPYVLLFDSYIFMYCWFARENELLSLHVGDNVQIQGVLGYATDGETHVLNHCSVLNVISPPEPPKLTEPVATLSVSDLVAEYDINSVAANKKYKDKTVILSGEVWIIYGYTAGRISLKDVSTYDSISITLENEDDVLILKEGSRIKVKGIVSESTSSTPELYMCQIIQ